jgi:hypothetical protein
VALGQPRQPLQAFEATMQVQMPGQFWLRGISRSMRSLFSGGAHVPADIDDGSIRQAVAYRPMALPVISHLDVRQVRKRHGGVEPPRILDRR